ncbi:MAG: glycyl-radical enzyme activating protein [Chloroflexota bacterium]|nr:glycyl-radical enzyme activating protein [Chloroflexota bacterium]
MPEMVKGIVTHIQRFSVHDGPGIRTLVFMKGCYLRCQWCDNPETINHSAEVGLVKAHCNKCGKCPGACPEQAITLDAEGIPVIDSQRCNNCAKCVAVCLPEALILYGREMTVEEVFQEVKQDEIFYEKSGGVTASGGEPLRQATFVKALFERCREAGIHTALETCGFAPAGALEQVLPVLQYCLFDLKHMNPDVHRAYTGQPNDVILDNARKVVESGVTVLFRSPLIPGINDSQENIKATASFLKELQGDKACFELMPYHRLGKAKYEALRRPYPLEELKSPEPDYAESIRQAYQDLGIHCTISK